MSKRDDKRHRYAQLMLAHRQEWQRYAHNQTKLAIRKDKSAVRTAFASTSSPDAAMKKVEAYHKGPSVKVWENVFKAVWLETGHAAAEFMHEYLTGKSVNLTADVSNKNAQEIQTLVWKDPVVDTVLSSWDSRVDDKIMNGGFLDKIEGINSTTQDKIHSTIQEGIANGDSHYTIGQNIESHLDETWAKRGETISRTETNSAMNAATREDMKATAPDLWKTWSIAGNNTRPWHEEVDGESIPQDEMFIVDGEDMEGPGDDSASPGNVVNCECTQLAEEPPAGTPVSDDEQARIDEAALAQEAAAEGVGVYDVPEFSNYKEAGAWAAENIQTVIGDMKGVDLEHARGVLDATYKIEQATGEPLPVNMINFGKVRSANAYAQFDETNKLITFKFRYKDLAAKLEEDNTIWRAESGLVQDFHAVSTHEGMVYHELGHAFDAANDHAFSQYLLKNKDELAPMLAGIGGNAANDFSINFILNNVAGMDASADMFTAVANGQKLEYVPKYLLDAYKVILGL